MKNNDGKAVVAFDYKTFGEDADEDDSEDEDGSTESDDSWKVSRYRYSKDEVKCWFDSLKKCHAYDLGFAADPGTDDKKCWCPCCDKGMKPWREDCEVEYIAQGCQKSKNDDSKDPGSLITHLKKMGETCEIRILQLHKHASSWS